MFTIKIFVTLLLIQSLQLTYAQDDDDFGLSSLSRFEPRRQLTLNSANQNDFNVDDDASSRGPVNPLPVQSSRNDDNNEDDYDDNQGGNSQPQAPAPAPVAVSPTLALASVKGQALPSSSGRLSFPRFPAQPVSSFVAPLPTAPAPRPTAVPVSVSTPLAPATVLVGKTNLGRTSSDPLLFPRLVRPVEQPKTVRIVKARVVRPKPIVADQSASLPSGIKTAQVNPTVTRVVRPVLVQSQPQPTFISQSVPQPISPFSFATPITSGSNGPNTIVSGGVKTIPFVPNSQVQGPLFRTVTTRRPTTTVTPVQPLDVDEDESDFSAGSRPAPVQISGIKTIPTANSVSRFPALRPVAQPTRLEVIYADENLNLRQQNEDDEDANAAGLSQSIFKYTRPTVSGPLRAVPQPYLIPATLQAPRRIPPRNNGIFFQPILTAAQPQPLTSSGKTNTLQSTFNARPQPVPTTSASQFTSSQSGPFIQRTLVRTPVPTSQPLIQIQEEPIPTFQQLDLFRNRPLSQPSIQQGQRPSLVAQSTSRPTIQPIVQIRGSPELPLPSPPRPVQIVRVTPAPAARPISQVRESVLPNVQQPVQISQPALPQVIQISDPARPLTQVRDTNLFAPLNPELRPAIPTVQTAQEQDFSSQQPVRPADQKTVRVNQVQLRESAFPITQSNNLGGSRFTEPQQPVQAFIPGPQEPQSFEILRLREPSQDKVATRQPQPQQPQSLVVPRPRLVPASLPSQPVARPSFQPIVQTNLPVAQPNSVRISQPLAPVVPQPQRRVVSFPSVQQQVQPVQISQPAPLPQIIQISDPARVPNVQFAQPLTQSSQPSFITPLPSPNRNQGAQPVHIQQQQRPTISFSQSQPTPFIVQQQPQQQRPAVLPSTQNTLSQSAQQQVVQIREQVPDDFSRIEQIRFARA